MEVPLFVKQVERTMTVRVVKRAPESDNIADITLDDKDAIEFAQVAVALMGVGEYELGEVQRHNYDEVDVVFYAGPPPGLMEYCPPRSEGTGGKA